MYFLLLLFAFFPVHAEAIGLLPGLPGKKLPSFDQNFSCIDSYKAKSYIKEYNIDVESFGGLELCDNQVETKKLFNDLKIIEEGYFSGSTTNTFIRGFVKASEYDYWMKTMTKGIRRGHDIPYATAYNRGGYFTMQNGWSKLSTLGRVGTIIHEARHTAGYGHRACNHGPYSESQLSGCDASVEEGGSHGVEMEYYSRVVLRGQNFHPAYTSMARLMNLARANFVFNKYPMKQKEALLVLTDKKAVVLKDNNKRDIALSKEMLSKSNSLQLKRSSFGATLVGEKIALAFDLYSWAKNLQTDLLEDVYSYYKMLKQNRSFRIIDLEEVDFGKVRHLVALTDNNELKFYNFPKGEWFSGTSIPAKATLKTVSPEGKKGLFVVTKEGLVYPVDHASLRLKPALPNKWPADVKTYGLWNATLLELRKDQRMYEAKSGTPFTELNASKKIIDFVKVPLYNAFDL